MLLEGKKILIMGIRNKWSIAFGIAKSAYENGAKLIFTYMGEENKDKIEELISEFKGSKAYVLNGASEDEVVKEAFTKIKEENGKIKDILKEVYEALVEKGYNPINQIVGYILSGDPTYITSYNDARNKIRQIERDELLEKMVKNYIGLDE